MSAPNTNIDRQKRNHRGPLLGIGLAVAVVSIGLVAYLGYLADEGQEPQDQGIQIDGRTGAAVEG